MTYKSEAELLADIRIELGTRDDVRLFRNSVGMLKDKQGRAVFYGLCKGSSDLIGWRSLVVTPDMVGKRIAQFVAIETKAQRGVMSARQTRFVETVNEHGGRAGRARSIWDAYDILDIYPFGGEDHE